MRKRHNITGCLQKISQGIILSLAVLAVIFAKNIDFAVAELSLYETMPGYSINPGSRMIFKMNPEVGEGTHEAVADDEEGYLASSDINGYSADWEENPNVGGNDLITLDDIIFQPETEFPPGENHHKREAVTMENIDKLRDINYLRKNFYTVDRRTDLAADLFDVDKFISEDLSIDKSTGGPKVLIFHTHSQERFEDSGGISGGVIDCGDRLIEILRDKYGIESIHNTDSFEIPENGSAYESMEPVISKILSDNPSVEIAIDLHRDGVNGNVRFVENINGKPTAQIMFFNGLSKLKQGGALLDIASLPNQYIASNLAFSFRMQLAANQLYPDLTRKVYLNAYRYSLHMLPKSLLVEVGADTNTIEEALNAMEPLADVLAEVVLN